MGRASAAQVARAARAAQPAQRRRTHGAPRVDRVGRARLGPEQRRRWEDQLQAARERIATRLPERCPTPHKSAYDTTDPAESHVAQRSGGPGRRIYRCRCGYRHWTTKPERTRR